MTEQTIDVAVTYTKDGQTYHTSFALDVLPTPPPPPPSPLAPGLYDIHDNLVVSWEDLTDPTGDKYCITIDDYGMGPALVETVRNGSVCEMSRRIASGEFVSQAEGLPGVKLVVAKEIENIGYEEGYRTYGKGFKYENRLEIIEFEEGSQLTEIWANESFAYCNNLTTVSFPVTSRLNIYGEFLFRSSSNVKTLDLSDQTQMHIEAYAFASCALENIIFPTTGRCQVGPYAFYQDDYIKHLTIPASTTYFIHGASGNSYAFYQCAGLEDVTIESGSEMTYIPARMFQGCSSLKTVSIPANISTINEYAFMYCRALQSFNISGNGLITINYGAFKECTNLDITLPNSVSFIQGAEAFYNVAHLEYHGSYTYNSPWGARSFN